ncbi:hypothetical protein KTS45_12255 [Halomicroarcula limicola]|uniref:Uncharacterized protein n=1 Tax=Haloarcula limicola TaxID=1429915 RepID=A0A8J8C8Y2_9EURY|nr:hypothetical protein [Halomicroarcula limicola]MBV0924970.1 hypothetical protein [Halomicroarcula limicola]
MSEGPSPLSRLRDPEHTGENRCLPCTAVNLVIAAALSGLAALVAVELAAAVAVAAVAAIALRGYLVPGTPRLTKRYLPGRALRAFGKDAPPAEPDDFDTLEKVRNHRENAVDADAFLAEEGVVTGDGEARELTDGFAAAVGDRLDAHAGGANLRDPLASVFEVEPDEVTIERGDHPSVTVGKRIREWPSQSALRVDVAAHEALTEWTDRWLDVPLEQRVNMLETIRSRWPVCPACGGRVESASEVQTSCCGVHEVLAVACVDCGERLAELDPTTHAGRLVS